MPQNEIHDDGLVSYWTPHKLRQECNERYQSQDSKEPKLQIGSQACDSDRPRHRPDSPIITRRTVDVGLASALLTNHREEEEEEEENDNAILTALSSGLAPSAEIHPTLSKPVQYVQSRNGKTLVDKFQQYPASGNNVALSNSILESSAAAKSRSPEHLDIANRGLSLENSYPEVPQLISGFIPATTTPIKPVSSRASELMPMVTASQVVAHERRYGPDAQDVGRQLLAWCSQLTGKMKETRRRSLKRNHSQKVAARHHGEIVFIPRKDQIPPGSMVHDHIDYSQSWAYNHPAVIVHIRDNDTVVCLKLTSEDMLHKWSIAKGATVGSTYRALLYLPINHRAGRSRTYSAKYDLPILSQEVGQQELRLESYVNTERLFEIEMLNVRTYMKTDDHGSGKSSSGSEGRKALRAKKHGFALDISSLKSLARWLTDTPTLRVYMDRVDGAGRPQITNRHLLPEGIKQLSHFVRQSGMKVYFDRVRWELWLRDKNEDWNEISVDPW